MFAGILGVQDDTADYKIKTKNCQSAPKASVVNYNQSKCESANQVYPTDIRRVAEMGFFFKDPQMINDLKEVFDWLKATSYRLGTPEWLQMRKELMTGDNKKAGSARKQRGMYKTMKGLGIIYLF